MKLYSNSQNNFAHTIRRRAIFILSGTIISVSSGVRIWSHIFPADFTDLNGAVGMEVDPSTTSFGFPRQFHELLARAVSIDYKSSQTKPIQLSQKEQEYEAHLQIQLNAISSVDNSAEVIGNLPSNQDLYGDGWYL